MIEVVEKPDSSLLQEINAYLGRVPADSGVCGEHDPRWLEVLRQGLGHRPYILLARAQRSDDLSVESDEGDSETDSNICGYLPLALVASRLFGRFLVSLPYLNRAGIVAQDPAIATALIDHAVQLSNRLNVKYLELRHHGELKPVLAENEQLGAKRDDKVRMVLDLPDDSESLWKSIGPKVRNQVRKAEKNDLQIEWGGELLLDSFYSVFAVNMRDLGTPVYPRRLFLSILERLADQAELALVRYQGQAVAGALLVHDRQSTQVPSASCLRQMNRTNANMWMYHQLLIRAMERGSAAFDFGRSSVDSGTYRFKKQWGAVPHPTVWQYHIRQGDVGDMRPDSPRNRRRVDTWKKLPVWLTRLVGPTIVRGIP